MGANAGAGARPAGPGSAFDRGAAVTRSLLGYGVVAGPFYLVVGLIQAFVRDGFDFARHPLSVLANGPGGWVQVANFVLSGLMVMAAALGFHRVLRRQGRAASAFLFGFGASMLVAAVFRADPVDGFPAGTPVGPPTSISTAGLIHFGAGTLGFTFLGVSCLCSAWAMARRKAPALARLSLVSGLAVLLGFFGGFALSGSGSSGILGIWFSVVVGWAWLLLMSVHLYRVAPDPTCGSPSR